MHNFLSSKRFAPVGLGKAPFAQACPWKQSPAAKDGSATAAFI